MSKTQDLELRSEEVQEILTRMPPFLVRWGSVAVLIILMMLYFISWIIKYPDIVNGQIMITTANPPEKIQVRETGRIEAILVKDRTLVQKNTPLAIIENAADYRDVLSLSEALGSEKDIINFNFSKFSNAQLGDVESMYSLFQKEFTTAALNKKLQPYKNVGSAQRYEKQELTERLNLLEAQKAITQSELTIQKNDLDRYENLYEKGVISTQEIEKQRLIFLQAQKNYKNMQGSVSQLKSSINELNRDSKSTLIDENTKNVHLEENLIRAYYQLKKSIKDWDLRYVLRSSTNGRITFLQIWTENQTVQIGEQIFAVIPTLHKNLIGKLKAPMQKSGKIAVGQPVNVRLENYPEREFGIIKGTVQAISLTPDKQGNLLIDVSFPIGLKTSYEKQIKFQQEMQGNADIVTDDLRLIERLLYQFREIFSRHKDEEKRK